MFEEGGDQGLENLKHQDTCVTLVIFTPPWGFFSGKATPGWYYSHIKTRFFFRLGKSFTSSMEGDFSMRVSGVTPY